MERKRPKNFDIGDNSKENEVWPFVGLGDFAHLGGQGNALAGGGDRAGKADNFPVV